MLAFATGVLTGVAAWVLMSLGAGLFLGAVIKICEEIEEK